MTKEHWAYETILYSKVIGWIVGYEDGTFRPDNFITRAEVVTIVNRLLNRSEFVDNNKFVENSFNDIDNSHWAYYQVLEASQTHDYGRVNNKEKWY